MMKKILQISSELNVGSIGKISEYISNLIIEQGWESYIAYGREAKTSKSFHFKIGTKIDFYTHAVATRLFDKHGFASKTATKKLISKLEEIKPDLIHLHHLHGYFINIELLFKYLKEKSIPVVWTFHDCWSFTGHCTHFEYVGCERWMTHCYSCPLKNDYPGSVFLDRSSENYRQKKQIFNGVANLTVVPVSYWLGDQVRCSFLKEYPLKVINNGVDLKVFKPRNNNLEIRRKYNIKGKYIILGVAGNWEARKGLDDFIALGGLLPEEYEIVLVGINKVTKKRIPENIITIERTTDAEELSAFYSLADVFVNPTLEDTFPTTNLEALASGTPVITYRTGGSVEAVDDSTGFIVEKNDLKGIIDKINIILSKGTGVYKDSCRRKAELMYDKNINFKHYIELYKELLNIS